MRSFISATLLFGVMIFGYGSPALADSKPMQFSLNSNKSPSSKSASGWDVASADDAGQCRASKYVGHGAFMALSAQDGTYALTVSSARDEFDVWKDYQVTLRMDGQEDSQTLRPAKFDTIVIPVTDISAFKKARNFDVAVGERHYSFTESKMGKVVGKLDQCVTAASAGNAVFAQMSPASGSAAAPASAPAAVSATPSATTTTSTTTVAADGSTVTDTTTTVTTVDMAPDEGLPPEEMIAPPADAAIPAPAAMAAPADAAAAAATATTTPDAAASSTPAASTAPTLLTDAPAEKAAEPAKTAETKPAEPKKPSKAAKASKTPASSEEALADSKSSLTYKPRSSEPACPKGQTCPVVPPADIEAAQKAKLTPVKEQAVSDVKTPVFVPAPVVPPAIVTGEACMATDEYKNLVRKIGLLEAEKEQLRSSSQKTLPPALKKVAECASESYQIKELRTEIELIRKENADLRRQAEAVKSADNLSEALNELDASVKNEKN